MSVESIERWWKVAFAVLAICMYAFGYAAYRVQQDARQRGLGKAAVTFWSVGVVFFGPIFLPLYAFFRSRAVFAGGRADEGRRAPYRLCPHCGAENPLEERVCVRCHKRVDIDLPSMGKKSCPFCGVMNPVEASRCSVCGQVIGYEELSEEPAGKKNPD